MAYLKIFSDRTHRKIGEMRLIDNQNIIFDTKGLKVGYCILTDAGEQYFDLKGNLVESLEKLLIKD